MKNKIYCSLLILVLFFTFACSDDSIVGLPEDEKSRGDIISSNLFIEYNLDLINVFLNVYKEEAGVDINISPEYSIKVYKIVYQTIDAKRKPVQASGSVYIPNGANSLPLLSAHHGTQTKRSNVGSVNPANSPEGILAGTLGYYGVVPDYLGLGESQILHPYLHAKSSATCAIDFIRAAKKFAVQNNIQLNGQLFLAGYSEGGYVTMAAHKEIETNYPDEFTVTASAPMAGPYYMSYTAKEIISRETYNEPSFLAFLVVTYNELYGWNNLNEIFQPQYSGIVKGLFDGSKTTEEINGYLTNKVSDLLKPEFISSFLNGYETAFNTALDDNNLLNWTPKAPMKLFHGTADEFVPYDNSFLAVHSFNERGSTTNELVSIEGGTHLSAAVPSLIGAALWFNEIRGVNPSSPKTNLILAEK